MVLYQTIHAASDAQATRQGVPCVLPYHSKAKLPPSGSLMTRIIFPTITYRTAMGRLVLVAWTVDHIPVTAHIKLTVQGLRQLRVKIRNNRLMHDICSQKNRLYSPNPNLGRWRLLSSHLMTEV